MTPNSPHGWNPVGAGIIEGMERTIAAAFWVTVAGGLLVAVGSATSLPIWVQSIGLVVFLGGVVLALTYGVRDARSRGRSLPGSLWSGLRVAVGWLFAFLP